MTSSTQHTVSKNGAKRDDTCKVATHLVPWPWVVGLARVLNFGAVKYGPHNWRKGMDPLRCYDSAARHLGAWLEGERTDPESGLPHLLHAAWNCLAAWSYETGSGAVQVPRSDQKEIEELTFPPP